MSLSADWSDGPPTPTTGSVITPTFTAATATTTTTTTTTTPLVKLTSVSEDDLKDFMEWRNSPEVYVHTRSWRYLTMENQREWFKKISTDPSIQMFSIRMLQHPYLLVGCCGLTKIDWRDRNAEVSIYIDPASGGKGYGREALLLLMTHAFEELGLNSLYAEIYGFNKASQSLFESCGFLWRGDLPDHCWRRGRWHSSSFFSTTLFDWHAKKGGDPFTLKPEPRY